MKSLNIIIPSIAKYPEWMISNSFATNILIVAMIFV